MGKNPEWKEWILPEDGGIIQGLFFLELIFIFGVQLLIKEPR